MKTPIQLPNPPEGYKAEAFIVAIRKPELGELLLGKDGKVWEHGPLTNFKESRSILQLQKIEAPAPKIKATEIKQWEPRIMAFECTCGAKDDIEIPLTTDQVVGADWDLSKIVSASSLAPKCKNLKPLPPKELVIEAFEITKHQGYCGTWINDRFEDIGDLMSRVDFRGFQFYGSNSIYPYPQGWQDSSGAVRWVKSPNAVERTLVHASHVLREVSK